MPMATQPSADLWSKEHRALFDIIDKLRSHGFGQAVDLPEIIVCGDQSAGKSSVLEAISGHPFDDGVCTRFATELVLRCDPVSKSKVSITPGPDRTVEDAARLRDFCTTLEPGIPLNQVIEAAKIAMGLGVSKRFSTDVLRVEISGPNQPHLTLVDLPGLFRPDGSEQSVKDAKTVSSIARKAMSRPRSIILAVVSASNELNKQEVMELARSVDPGRVRTLGIITKPDQIEEGSESEKNYLRLARNQDVVLSLGWHVLRNPAEEGFFSKEAWRGVDPSSLGVAALRKRLSAVLWQQILPQLPALREDVWSRIRECEDGLDKLGESRETAAQQRRYLLGVSRRFSSLMTAAVEGDYSDAFFGDASSDEGYARRIRAVVQNTLRDFVGTMHRQGKSECIVDGHVPMSEGGEASPVHLNRITRAQYLERVLRLMERSRGRELPGTVNPLIVQHLFKEQCQPWKEITTEAIDSVVAAAASTAMSILHHVALAKTSGSISVIVNDGIDALKAQLDGRLAELLAPHYEGHPITPNRFLTDMVQKARAQRRKRDLEASISSLDAYGSIGVPVRQVVDLLEKFDKAELDMEKQAAELAVDYSEAYYSIAINRVIDEVGHLAVERQLIRFLPDLFTPDMVYDLTDDQVSALAAEDEQAVAERARCTELLAALRVSMVELKRLDVGRTVAAATWAVSLPPVPEAEQSSPEAATPQPPTPEPVEERDYPIPMPTIAEAPEFVSWFESMTKKNEEKREALSHTSQLSPKVSSQQLTMHEPLDENDEPVDEPTITKVPAVEALETAEKKTPAVETLETAEKTGKKKWMDPSRDFPHSPKPSSPQLTIREPLDDVDFLVVEPPNDEEPVVVTVDDIPPVQAPAAKAMPEVAVAPQVDTKVVPPVVPAKKKGLRRLKFTLGACL